jgi:hypothetical protein
MYVNATVRLFSDGSRPIITLVMGNLHNDRSAVIKFVFVLYDGLQASSFERSWTFRFPRPIPNHLHLTLIGVNYTAAIFEGVQRGLTIGVIAQEPTLVDLQSDEDNERSSEE